MLALNDNPPELHLGSRGEAPKVWTWVDPEIFGPCPWAVALVGSRKEKAVAWWLLQHGISYFLPYVRSKTDSGNTVLLPLFDGILFFQAHHEPIQEGYYTSVTPMEYEVRTARFVHGVLKTAVQVKMKREMAAIYRERSLKLCKYRPGEPIRVIDGPFVNFEGQIVQHDPERPLCQFKLELGFAEVHIPAEYIVRLSDAQPMATTQP